MREQAGGLHLLEHKSSKKMRSIANDVELAKPDAKKAKKSSASEPVPPPISDR